MDIDPRKEYERWLAWPKLEPAAHAELRAIAGDDAAIRDRFWRRLAFGTGGLRGIMGVGTNRVNRYTVAAATAGLADWLLETGHRSACIAYDTRHGSKAFAEITAGVLCARGIRTYLYEDVRPTPMLSFAVRPLRTGAGVVITASHNPKQYNGYKVYGPDGGQITDSAASTVAGYIARYKAPDDIAVMLPEEARADGLLVYIGEDVDAAYCARVKELVIRRDFVAANAGELSVLYTPLYGSGNVPVRRVLAELGFSRVSVVEAQAAPCGDFPAAPKPNPEEPEAFSLALEQAEGARYDLIFATDPDCDRLGLMARSRAGGYTALTGNQVGALLCQYIITSKKEQGTLPANAAVVKTIVTTDLARLICEENNVALAETLTGFKYIGEQIGRWEQSRSHTFLLGFEESYGYLAGTFVRDKDAVIASVLIAEMALWHKKQGHTLTDALELLWREYGYAAEKLLSLEMEGEAGQRHIAAVMNRIRATGLAGGPAPGITEDYSTGCRRENNCDVRLDFPTSNVLKFIFEDQSWMVFRPSGTEPKLKVYVGAHGGSLAATQKRLGELELLAKAQLTP